jgi:hypothetical protein
LTYVKAIRSSLFYSQPHTTGGIPAFAAITAPVTFYEFINYQISMRVSNMSECGCGCTGNKGGPFSKGKELVEFVFHAHGGNVRDQKIRQGSIETFCQGCKAAFVLETYLGMCPKCGGVHAVAPMCPTAENIQFAGSDYTLPA